jgi:ribosome maturation factor RimP
MIQRDIEELLRPSVESLDCEWWGLEFNQQSRHSFLRIYIDKAQGVGIDDCERVSRQVSALLDVHDLIPGEYRLEISSPGIPRPLFYPEQYQRYVGQSVALKLSRPVLNKRKIEGVIVSVNESAVTLHVDLEPQEFLFSNIVKASLTVERGEA